MRHARLAALAGATMVACGLLSGCYDRSELEEQAFLITLGIDRDKNHAVHVVARVAVPSKLASSTSGAGGGGGDFRSGTPIIGATGRTIQEALALMNTGVERSINLTHLSAVVFGEQAARSGLLSYIRPMVRYREFRRTLYLFVAKGSLTRVFTRDRPILETSVTRLIEDLHDTSRRTGFAPSVQLHGFLSSLEMNNDDPVLPVLAYNERTTQEGKDRAGSVKHSGRAAEVSVPGQVSRTGGNPVENVGAALFREDRLVGFLNGQQARYLQLLNGSLHRVFINFPSPSGDGYVTLWLRYAEPLEVMVHAQGPKPRIDIRQSFVAELLGEQGSSSYVSASQRTRLERVVADEVKRREIALVQTIFTRYRVDPFHFFQYARGSFPTVESMRKFSWRSVLPKVALAVAVNVRVRRLGTQLNPSVND